MTAAWSLFLIVAATLFAATWAVVWSRRDGWVRHSVLPALVFALPLVGFAAISVLSWHRPAALAWDVTGQTKVIGSKMIEGTGIYLYLDTGRGEPRAIVLPWDIKTAQRLQDAMRESERRGQKGALLKFDPSWERREMQIHPIPQPTLPIPKGEDPPVQRYERL